MQGARWIRAAPDSDRRPRRAQPRERGAQPRGAISQLLPRRTCARFRRDLMLRIGLRFHRTGMISAAVIGAFSGMVQSLGFQAVVGTSEAARQQFGLQMQLLGRQLSYLVPLPVHPETLAGYVQWRAFGFFPVIFGFWALIAGSGAIRGDEDRGLLELWLASGTSRARLKAARTGAFVIAAAASILIVL